MEENRGLGTFNPISAVSNKHKVSFFIGLGNTAVIINAGAAQFCPIRLN